jgi:hypothetical protein
MSANSSDTQTVIAQASGLHNTYHTNYTFAVLATAASLVAILSVLLTFNGFWHIGRKVSMSPIELAKAFNAPLLQNADSNAPVKTLLEQVGVKPVQYGMVRAGPSGRKPVPRHRGSSGNIMSPYRDDFTNDIHEASTADADAHIPQRYSPLIGSPRSKWKSAFTSSSSSGYQNDMELLSPTETRHAATSREWLELADPRKVIALRSNTAFNG